MSVPRPRAAALLSSTVLSIVVGFMTSVLASPAVDDELISVKSSSHARTEPSPFEASISVPDLPSEEISLGNLLPQVSADDSNVSVFGRPNGFIAMVVQEDFAIRVLRSSNGGVSFGAPVAVAGGPGQLEAVRNAAQISDDGTLYVAALIIDPQGQLGLQVSHSVDMGVTFSPPIDLVRYGSPLHGLTGMSLAAGPNGHVAIAFSHTYESEYYVTASSDHGTSWTPPVRIDPGFVPGQNYGTLPKLAFSQDGSILHASYGQARGPTGRNSVWYTRSTNGGASFESERALNISSSRADDINVANDGTVLVTGHFASNLTLWRSIDGGVSFATVLGRPASGVIASRIVVSPDSGVVFVAAATLGASSGSYNLPFGPILLWRSTDRGATLDAFGNVFGNAAPHFSDITMIKTALGHWIATWTDVGADTYAAQMTDVLVRTSADDGATWDSAVRANSGAAGSTVHSIGTQGLALAGSDAFLLAWLDGRDESARSRHVYSTHASFPVSFSADARIESVDRGTINVAGTNPDLTTDGVDHVYTAFAANSAGPYPDILVSASHDGGRTFEAPRQATTLTAGSRMNLLPRVLARQDGRVYLLYQSEALDRSGREIRVNTSTDGGTTWRASEASLGLATNPCGYPGPSCGEIQFEDIPFQLGPPGVLYAAWELSSNLKFARSSDDGVSFSSTTLNTGPSGSIGYPAMCASGDQVVLAYASGSDIRALVSFNQGLSWSSPTILSTGGSISASTIACAQGTATDALVTWTGYRNGLSGVYVSRWNGLSWTSEKALVTGSSGCFYDTAHMTGQKILVAYVCSNEVRTRYSSDGGLTFEPSIQLDAGSWNPSAYSSALTSSSDNLGHVWVSWFDSGAGVQGALLARQSIDFGHSFGSLYRLNRDQPLAGRGIATTFRTTQPEALPGVAFFLFLANRSSNSNVDLLVNAFDAYDFDRDGAPSGSDCNDFDPSVISIPLEVSGTRLSKGPDGIHVDWTSQSETAGRQTYYEIVGGSITTLHDTGTFSSADCVSPETAGTEWVDTGTTLPAATGQYYLVRAKNACGSGTYGDSSVHPDPRDLLDANGPCP